jgi:hypothetical protein
MSRVKQLVQQILEEYTDEEINDIMLGVVPEVQWDIDVLDTILTDILVGDIGEFFDLTDEYEFSVAERVLEVADKLSIRMGIGIKEV